MPPMLQPFMFTRQPSQPFQPNTDLVFNLPLNGKICKLNVLLDGTLTINNVGAANGNPWGGTHVAPAHLIRRVIVRANPAAGSRYFGGEVVNATPRGLLRNAITERSKYMGELNGSVLGDGAPGAYPIYSELPVWFADPNIARQYTTALNADPAAYQSVQVIVQTGDLTTLFPGSDRTADYGNLRVRVTDERKDLDGDTLCLFQEDHFAPIAAPREDFTDAGMRADGAFLSWHIFTEVGANHLLQDTILNRVRIQGTGINWEVYANDVRQKMYDDGWYDVAEAGAGQYFIDLSDGNIFKPVPAPGLSALFDVNMVSAANIDGLRIFTRRYFVPAGFDASKPMREYSR